MTLNIKLNNSGPSNNITIIIIIRTNRLYISSAHLVGERLHLKRFPNGIHIKNAQFVSLYVYDCFL